MKIKLIHEGNPVSARVYVEQNGVALLNMLTNEKGETKYFLIPEPSKPILVRARNMEHKPYEDTFITDSDMVVIHMEPDMPYYPKNSESWFSRLKQRIMNR